MLSASLTFPGFRILGQLCHDHSGEGKTSMPPLKII